MYDEMSQRNTQTQYQSQTNSNSISQLNFISFFKE